MSFSDILIQKPIVSSIELKLEKESKEIFHQILQTTYPDSKSVTDFLDRYEQKFQIALYAEIIGVSAEVLKKKFMEAANAKEN